MRKHAVTCTRSVSTTYRRTMSHRIITIFFFFNLFTLGILSCLVLYFAQIYIYVCVIRHVYGGRKWLNGSYQSRIHIYTALRFNGNFMWINKRSNSRSFCKYTTRSRAVSRYHVYLKISVLCTRYIIRTSHQIIPIWFCWSANFFRSFVA